MQMNKKFINQYNIIASRTRSSHSIKSLLFAYLGDSIILGFRDRGQKYTFDPMIVYPTNGSRILFNEMKKRLMADSKLFDQVCLCELR